jgi:single-stranded-DNA-specific exonuclease
MSFEESDFERFQTAFDQVVRELLPPEALQAEVLSDGELQPEQFNLSLGHELREAGPWGQMFPEPLFDGEFYLVQQRIVGEKHLKLVVSPDISGQTIVDAIAFNVDISIWPNNKAEKVRLAYKLDVNEFRGRESVQLMVEYIEAI